MALETPRKFKLGLVQMSMTADPHGESRACRGARGGSGARRRGRGVPSRTFPLAVFLPARGAACFDLAEPVPGPTTEALGQVARRAGVALIVPVFERRAAGLYHNSAAIIDADGEMVGLYRKMHIPDDPAYYEKFYFTPGDLGFRAFDTSMGRLGTLICWDQWYPEAARLTALAGASVLFYPTAIGWHPDEKEKYGAAQRDAWRTVQRGHAIANGVYVAAVNRVGFEPVVGADATAGQAGSSPGAASKQGIEFFGSSFVCDPFGIMIAEASSDKEEIIFAEVNLDRIEIVRRHWPFLRDRRIDAYGGIELRQIDEESRMKNLR